ncbi:histone transcription regulator 1 [Flagelloscypha sp. PMI_526]|nr:histone transcription regulator 1 [Flagelloscypha sp. PMI_526]
MRFVKPAWVAHGDSDKNDKRLPIFSIHVHPDGSRVATGGLDAKIRIWSTKPILNPASEASGKPPKSLCTLAMHTGPVLAVRWAFSGRWLASGSDDQIVMIWDLDPHARGRVWGSDEVNVEGWKPLKRLPGHESDVVDVAWSPEDRYLASVGLDSAVMIWCGYTLERLRKLDLHQGFVKGVCWDPVGEYLATQSDDKTVKIWRTSDWKLEAEVKKPFEDSPSSTFYRRLSWSPDGAHITASNATNNKGFVFIAAVITRNTWTSEISLVGHENTVQVASYNPHIFLRDPSQPPATANICSVVALGADDNSVSIWQTKSARPLIVAKEVFERQILDLSWSWDGLVLYAASSDGTIAAFQFDSTEIDGIAPHSVQTQYLKKFNFTPPPLPAGYSHTIASGDSAQLPPAPDFAPPSNQVNGGVNKLVAKRKKPGLPSAHVPSAAQPQVNGVASVSMAGPRRAALNQHPQPPQPPPLSYSQPIASSSNSFFPSEAEQPFGDPSSSNGGWGRDMMDVDHAPIASLEHGGRKPFDEKLIRARTLGGERPRDVISPRVLEGGPITAAAGIANLPVPPLMNVLSQKVDGLEDIFEARNAEGPDGVNQVMYLKGKDTVYKDFLPSPALSLAATKHFCAAAMQDGTINVYTPHGRRLCHTLVTGSPAALVEGSGYALLVITTTGQVYSWNLRNTTAFFPPTSLSPILSGAPNRQISRVSVRDNGIPCITCNDATAFSFDSMMSSWVQVSSKWWSEGSDVWHGRQRSSSTASSRGIVTYIEGQISEAAPDSVHAAASKPRPEWWSQAMTLGHLETKLQSAKLLESPQEYKQTLLVYAKRLTDEAFKAKAEELIKELFGPVYWRPGRSDSWNPMVAGLVKRELLRDVLSIFAKSRTLTQLGADWQATLKRAMTEE